MAGFISNVLGVGGEGIVIKHMFDGNERAVKLSTLKSANEEGEISNTGSLRHKNIIQLLGWSLVKCEATNQHLNAYGNYICTRIMDESCAALLCGHFDTMLNFSI